MYRFDEVVFELPASSLVIAEEIEADFEKWWNYGMSDQAGQDEEMKQDPVDPDTPALTRGELTVQIQKLQEQNEKLEEQNKMLEDCLLEISEVVYA